MGYKLKKTSVICLLMAFLVMIPLLSSCNGDKTDKPLPDEKQTGEQVYLDDLGKFDFGGYDFKVMSVTSKPGTYTLFDVAEESAVILDNSIFRRNREIEERFNIEFKAYDGTYQQCYNTLQTQYNSNSSDYDLIMLINRDAYSAAISGQLMPMERLTHLDLSKDYYLHDINEMSSIDGKQFFAYSEESLYTFQRAACIVFNKAIAAQYDEITDYYDAVNNYEWTFEKMYEDMSLATTKDGEENVSVYGMYGHYSYMFTAFFIAAGQRFVEKNGNTLKFTAVSNQKLDTIATEVLDHISQGEIGYFTEWGDSVVDNYNNQFINSGALFNATVVGKIPLLKDITGWDYGVLPWPMYSTEQHAYYSWVVDAWLHVCPATNPDPERTSVIMEALASGSAKWVYPAYYEHALVGRSLRDSQSVEMLEIIRYNRIFDWGTVTWATTIRQPIEDMVFLSENHQSVATVCRSIVGVVNNLIKEAEQGAAKITY